MIHTEARRVEVYEDRAGRAPFVDWLGGLKDAVARARIRARINRLRPGNFGDCKAVGEGVRELRVDHGPGFRVYFPEAEGHLVILLCGGDKGSQKRDIEQAREFWADYRSRGNA